MTTKLRPNAAIVLDALHRGRRIHFRDTILYPGLTMRQSDGMIMNGHIPIDMPLNDFVRLCDRIPDDELAFIADTGPLNKYFKLDIL